MKYAFFLSERVSYDIYREKRHRVKESRGVYSAEVSRFICCRGKKAYILENKSVGGREQVDGLENEIDDGLRKNKRHLD